MVSRAAPEFWQLYHELSLEAQAATRRAYQVFIQNPAHPGLRLERLRSDPRAWSVRVTRDIRATAMSGFGFGLEHTAPSICDSHTDTSCVK